MDASEKTAVSLLSGATETVYALGLQGQLVGRSHECDYPPHAVATLPACSRELVDHHESAASIDQQVKQLSETGEPLYKLEAATVGALAPDVLIVQDSCRICAVSPAALAGAGPALADCEVVVLRPKTLADVLADIVTVAAALGHRRRGEDYVAKLQARLAGLPAPPAAAAAGPPRVAVLEWVDPLMSCGYWIPELVAAAGCSCVLAGPGDHTGYTTLDELLASRPTQVILASCGFDVRRCAAELCAASLASRQAVLALVAAGAAVWLADGNRFFNRSGPGVVESAVIVAQCAAGGAAVPGEPDLRGVDGFVSLEEGLELEHTTIAAFGEQAAAAAAAAAAGEGWQSPATGAEAAEAAAAALAGAAAVVEALQAGDVEAAHSLSAVSAQMSVETYRCAALHTLAKPTDQPASRVDNLALSVALALALYRVHRKVIVEGEDFAPLSDSGHFTPEWFEPAELIAADEAKLRLRLRDKRRGRGGAAGGAGGGDGSALQYDFRMVRPAGTAGAWMVKGVSKL